MCVSAATDVALSRYKDLVISMHCITYEGLKYQYLTCQAYLCDRVLVQVNNENLTCDVKTRCVIITHYQHYSYKVHKKEFLT